MVQKVEIKDGIYITNADSVPIEDMPQKGAKNAKVRFLIDERQGSNRFALRLYTVEKGGHTPLDQHEYEHQVYVLNGRGLVRGAGKGAHSELQEGDAIFVQSNAIHQFINENDEPFVFLCVKGNPKLYDANSGRREQISNSEDSDRNCC